jgi:hypothetical protein
VDFIEDHEPLEGSQRQHRIDQAGEIAGVFEIEDRARAAPRPHNALGKCRLADLTRPEERDDTSAS